MEAPGVAPIRAQFLTTKEEFHSYLDREGKLSKNKEDDETERSISSDHNEPSAKSQKVEDDGKVGSLPKEGDEETSDAKEPQGRKRARGQNKSRPCMKPMHYEKERLCPSIVQERADKCFFGPKCRFLHNVKEYLSMKPPDLGDSCVLFEKFGKCIYGATCRFAGAHFGEDCKNVVNLDLLKKWEGKLVVKNSLTKELQQKLRKKKVSFDRSNRYLQHMGKPNHADGSKGQAADIPTVGKKETTNCSAPKGSIEDVGLDTAAEKLPKVVDVSQKDVSVPVVLEGLSEQTAPVEPVLKTVGSVTDEDIVKLRLCEKKKLDLQGKLYLAPLTTVRQNPLCSTHDFSIQSMQCDITDNQKYFCVIHGLQCGNLPFRRICKQYGADVTCGEMAVCTNLLQGQSSEWALLKRHHTEDLFGVQLEGAFPDTMTKCAELLNQTVEVDFVDINVGCPIDLVYKKGGGCALMSRTNKFEQIVRGMNSVLDIPLTVKIRTGVQEKVNLAHKIIPNLRTWGASLVTLHGRSREQRYTKVADWEYIAQCAKIANPMPLFGNGDILSFEDANRAMQTGVSGIMIARGALIKPWIFTEIKEQRHWDISSTQRFDVLKDFTNYGLEHWGSDTQGVEKTRKFLLEWLSFLCRYIPTGLLEHLPQRINERPPYYVGRDYLETLMASQNVDDWIKISEMLLGPVPSSFTFLPKHKANSYK